MKRMAMGLVMVVLAVSVVSLCIAAEKGKLELKVGDEVYACNCGEKCPCDSMSMNPGKCTCGNDMVKASVTKVEPGKATLKSAGWTQERVFKTVGKYTCDCGPGCKCNTISQNPGKCTCGVDMKKL
jgi:hypothetical protein